MSKNNIRAFPSKTTDSVAMLEMAKNWGLTDVLILGWDADGEFVIGCSDGSLKETSWLLRCANQWVDKNL